MRTYPVKKGRLLSADIILQQSMKVFGSGRMDGNAVVAEFPGLKSIKAWLESGKFCVETVAEKSGDPMESIRRFNQFIQEVTGYTTKERKKLMSRE